jgi:hypothetical protein
MESLTTPNPHSERSVPLIAPSPEDSKQPDALVSWRNACGDAVSDESKKSLAVDILGIQYIMADVRLINRSGGDKGEYILEFFFDGECDQLTRQDGPGLSAFFEGLQVTIREAVSNEFRRRIKDLIRNKAELSHLREQSFPNVEIVPAGSSLENTFRDAGCMLSFIAVRMHVTEECANAIGAIAFPHHFRQGNAEKEVDTPVPKWLVGMGAATIVMGLGTIYAWTQIFLFGNQHS